MNTNRKNTKMNIFVVASAFLFISACSMNATKPDGADNARSKLTRLQSNSQLSNLAPVEIKEAEEAVLAAEIPREDKELETHLVFMADRKIDIAQQRAQTRYYEDQREKLSNQRETARLDSRTREADMARNDAKSARVDAENSRANELTAQQHNADLQKQIAELNAKETDRGLVVTLGDVLFASGESDLKGGAEKNLDKLVAFLTQYPDRTAAVEGHTDSMGSDDFNQDLSQRRADRVKTYLRNQGIAAERITASGKGEISPVSSNSSATGRQQNRRVEVIISNSIASTE